MSGRREPLTEIIHRLESHYGSPSMPDFTDPLEYILLENVGYLIDDDRRQRAFEALRDQVGLHPTAILSAMDGQLLSVAKLGGRLPEGRVKKIRSIAHIALTEFNCDLKQVLAWPRDRAMRALKKFPGISDPGAEKILLFTKTLPVLALESNGLRVLVRIGFGDEKKDYAATYRSVQEALRDQLPDDFDSLIRAHLLLRRHGKEVCKNAYPACEACPAKRMCEYFAKQS